MKMKQNTRNCGTVKEEWGATGQQVNRLITAAANAFYFKVGTSRLLNLGPGSRNRAENSRRYRAVEEDTRWALATSKNLTFVEVPRNSPDGRSTNRYKVSAIVSGIISCYCPPGQSLIGVSEQTRWKNVEETHAEHAKRHGEIGNLILKTARDMVYMTRGGLLRMGQIELAINAGCLGRGVLGENLRWTPLNKLLPPAEADELQNVILKIRGRYDRIGELVEDHFKGTNPWLYDDIINATERETRRELIAKAKQLFHQGTRGEQDLAQTARELKSQICDILQDYSPLMRARIIGEVYGGKGEGEGLSKKTLIGLRFVR
ncbi:Uncharacterised protein [Candidatus Gugararchaeum adminiculabundum]|nr:Uncharacterised protein [Candidatus Gugararchaeum adminiculabundum]